MEKKICSRCKIELPIDNFNKKSKNKDGYRSECKECQAIDSFNRRKMLKNNDPNYVYNPRMHVGQKFGKLTIIESLGSEEYGNVGKKRTMWLCKCDCGNEKICTSTYIKKNKSQSCGCELSRRGIHKKLEYNDEDMEWLVNNWDILEWDEIQTRFPNLSKQQIYGVSRRLGRKTKSRRKKCYEISTTDLLGKTIGRLTVLEFCEIKDNTSYWLCECECGNKVIKKRCQIVSGVSCGCARENGIKALKEANKAKRIDDETKHVNRLYVSYRNSANSRGYDFEINKNTFADVIKRNCYYCNKEPSNYHSIKGRDGFYCYNGIDRVDNEIGYTDENIVPCCSTCNKAKGTQTVTQFYSWIKRINDNFTEEKYTLI